jgi:SagB-type dehydrogenase family enzyme
MELDFGALSHQPAEEYMKPIVQELIKSTSPAELSQSPQDLGLPQPPLELPLPDACTLIYLPSPGKIPFPAIDLRQAVEQRVSVRRYSEAPVTLDELSALLWLTQGVKSITRRPSTLRTVPSAGARHAFETILLVNRVTGLEPGLYRFSASQHALLQLPAPEDIRERITQACYNQSQVLNSAVTFIWVAVAERMTWRYVERSARYLFLDAGHVCQNLYLAAEAVDCGVCAIAAYNDPELNNELDLDGENQFVIYLASVGKKRTA